MKKQSTNPFAPNYVPPKPSGKPVNQFKEDLKAIGKVSAVTVGGFATVVVLLVLNAGKHDPGISTAEKLEKLETQRLQRGQEGIEKEYPNLDCSGREYDSNKDAKFVTCKPR